MRDKGNPPSARVAAARAILECGLKCVELMALSERVAKLEERLGGEK
jgi:hypothetical protein